MVLRLLKPGDTFAEAPAVLGQASRVDALALADTVLVMVATPCILALLQRDTRFGRNLAKLLAERTRELMAELEGAMQPSAWRLATYLDAIAQPGELPGTWAARLPVSKTLLAARLGMKKETLSRLLRQFARSGIISVSQRHITILDRERLLRPGSNNLESSKAVY